MSKIFGGLDLSKNRKNTSICFIRKKRKFSILFVRDNLEDNEVISLVEEFKPLYFSIDAPLVWEEYEDRKEDKILRKFFYDKKIPKPGILPFYIKSMIDISKRGRGLYFKLKNITEVLETHPTASIRALGFREDYKKNKKEFIKLIKKISHRFLNLDTIKNHNQLDALFCALFSFYFYEEKNIFIVRKKIPYGIIVKL